MIPDFAESGNLPPGMHSAVWDELETRYGGTPRRRILLQGLREGLRALQAAGCQRAYIDGSFVTERLTGWPAMIANERQYRMTKAWLERFEEGLTYADEAAAGLDPLLQGAMRDQYTGQVAELREQLAHYDALQAGHIRTLALRSLDDIPLILVQARIAAGLTHKQLATLLAMPEQQVQRYEAREYQGVSFDRLQMVADALGVIIEGRARLPHPAESAGQADEDIGAPVVEEDLVAVKRGEEESRVHPHKDVMQGQQTISVPVTREDDQY